MKVTLEVTANGWKWTVIHEGKVIATQTMRQYERGQYERGFRSTEKAAVFEEALDEYPRLLDEIESISIMGIATALEWGGV